MKFKRKKQSVIKAIEREIVRQEINIKHNNDVISYGKNQLKQYKEEVDNALSDNEVAENILADLDIQLANLLQKQTKI